MTEYAELWDRLAAPFADWEVGSVPVSGSVSAPFLSAPTVMNRLDEVMGWENWRDSYERDPGGSDNILCRLAVRLPSGEWIEKSDVGSPSKTGDEHEDDKGAVSDALKRAAVKFGVGRYLKKSGVFVAREGRVVGPVQVAGRGAGPGRAAERGTWGSGGGGGAAGAPRGPGRVPRERPAAGGVASSGRQLYGFCKDREAEERVGLLKYMAAWGQQRGYPPRMVDWSDVQAAAGHAEVVARLARSGEEIGA